MVACRLTFCTASQSSLITARSVDQAVHPSEVSKLAAGRGLWLTAVERVTSKRAAIGLRTCRRKLPHVDVLRLARMTLLYLTTHAPNKCRLAILPPPLFNTA